MLIFLLCIITELILPLGHFLAAAKINSVSTKYTVITLLVRSPGIREGATFLSAPATAQDLENLPHGPQCVPVPSLPIPSPASNGVTSVQELSTQSPKHYLHLRTCTKKMQKKVLSCCSVCVCHLAWVLSVTKVLWEKPVHVIKDQVLTHTNHQKKIKAVQEAQTLLVHLCLKCYFAILMLF